jgi:hypothetical protein
MRVVYHARLSTEYDSFDSYFHNFRRSYLIVLDSCMKKSQFFYTIEYYYTIWLLSYNIGVCSLASGFLEHSCVSLPTQEKVRSPASRTMAIRACLVVGYLDTWQSNTRELFTIESIISYLDLA